MGALLTKLSQSVAAGFVFRPPKPSYSRDDGRVYLDAKCGYDGLAAHLDFGYETTVLFLHGNAEDLGTVCSYFESKLCAKLKVNAFVPEFPGYGLLKHGSAAPSEAGVYAAAVAAYRYLTGALGIEPGKIVIYGRSLGSAPAVHLASGAWMPPGGAAPHVRGLIVQSGILSVFRAASQSIRRALPGDFFVTIDRITEVPSPTLVIHGRRDALVPFSHGKTLHARARWAVAPLFLDGAGHNDIETHYAAALMARLKTFVHTEAPRMLQIKRRPAGPGGKPGLDRKSGHNGTPFPQPGVQNTSEYGQSVAAAPPSRPVGFRSALALCGGGRSVAGTASNTRKAPPQQASSSRGARKWTPRNAYSS